MRFALAGKRALVTGASSGIGEAFARALAARGADLILVARTEERLRALADELRRQPGVRAEVAVSDLSREGSPQALVEELAGRGLSVDVLINNAGFGTYGRFEEIDAEREHAELILNVVAVIDLTHRLVPEMLAKGDGAIINVASTTAFLPTPYLSVYAASKAFVLNFTEALWAEYRTRGIRVVCLCPGATRTRFFDVVGDPQARWGIEGTPEGAVAAALQALDRGSPTAVPGWFNRIYVSLPRLVPRALVARVAERTMRPRSTVARPP